MGRGGVGGRTAALHIVVMRTAALHIVVMRTEIAFLTIESDQEGGEAEGM